MTKLNMYTVDEIMDMEETGFCSDSVNEMVRTNVRRKELKVSRKHEEGEVYGNNRHTKAHRKW